jgi:diguanylate cyclase (GGDEF)-like protein
VNERPLAERLEQALAGLPEASEALRPLLESCLREQRRLDSQLRKIARIGDGYQKQLRQLNLRLEESNLQLSHALAEVRTLQGFIPICARCKRIRDDQGYWEQIEAYLSRQTDAVFTHGVCPECAPVLFPRPAAAGPEIPVAPAHGFQDPETRALESRLEALAQDIQLRDNPLTPELAALARRHLRLIRRLGKISRISDGYQDQLKKANIALTEASNTDLVTGLQNRRAMVERLQSEISRSTRGRLPPTVLMADVDKFKDINDTFGHEAGDRTLHALAQALGASIRNYDTCARWGGDEFLVLLPETDLAAARAVGEKLRAAAARIPALPEQGHPRVTLSIGVATGVKGEGLTSLLRRADLAVYEAKRQGRDRVVAAGSEPAS